MAFHSTGTSQPAQRGVHAGLYYETHFFDDGAKLPVVILPGLLSDGRQLRRLLRKLQRKAVVIDPLGNGRSDAPSAAAEYLLPALVPRLSLLLDAIGVKKADLIGLSMGGLWAQHALLCEQRQAQASAKAARWRSAVLVGTCAHISPRLRSLLLGLRSLFTHELPKLDAWRIFQPLLFSPAFLERPSTVPILEFLATETKTPKEAALGQLDSLLAHDLGGRLGELHGVRGVLGGELDILMPPLAQKALAEAIRGVPVEILRGAGHAAWLEEPEVLARALAAVLPD